MSRPRKLAPRTTWDHVAAHTHRKNDAPPVETKPFKVIRRGGHSGLGRSWIEFPCPFCQWAVVAYVWSISGGGKRCDNKQCRAIFGSDGNGHRLVCDPVS